MKVRESIPRGRRLDRWSRLGLFFTANVFFGAGLFFHAFLYNFYLDALGLGESIMGGAAAALTAGGLAALLPAGIVVDRRGTRLTYYVAAGLTAAGLAAGALVEAPLLIYAAAFLAGAGTSAWRVVTGPIIMQLTDRSTRARAFSWNVGLLVGSGGLWMALAGAAPAWIESAHAVGSLGGLRIALLLGAGGTVLSAIFFRLLRYRFASGLRPAHVSAGALPAAVPRTLGILVLLVALWMIAPALVTPFFNIYFQRAHDLALSDIGIIFALTHALTALVIFGSGEVASRLGPVRTLACWVLVFGPTLWGLAASQTVVLAVTLYLVQGMVAPATNPLIDQILLELAPAHRRGAVSSWRNAATEVSGIVGAGIGGVLLERSSFGTLFGVAGSLAIVAVAVLLIVLYRLRSQVGAQRVVATTDLSMGAGPERAESD